MARSSLILLGVLLPSLPATADTARPPAAAVYPLDEVPRQVPPRGALRCPGPRVRYRGTHLRYHKPVTVHPDFVPRLARFEALLVEVATLHYGRAPAVLVHIGAYNCRRTRGYPDLLSEHALGNALDVEALRFPAAPRQRRAALPGRLRRAFSVSVERHWSADPEATAPHAAFLRALTERLLEDDTFRVMLGPAFPGHRDHFHFDMAPYRLIAL
jgi:hypothetical protein